MTLEEEYEIIWRFVEHVNRKAEHKMAHTGKLEGAHYMAMQEELAIIQCQVEAMAAVATSKEEEKNE